MNRPSADISIPRSHTARAEIVCPVCSSPRLYYLFSVYDHRVICCHDCGLLATDPPVTVVTPGIGSNYDWVWNEINLAVGDRNPGDPFHLLYIGPRFGAFHCGAPDAFHLESTEIDNLRSDLPKPRRESYQVVVLDEALNQVLDPRLLLEQARRWLTPNGLLVVTTLDLETWSLKCDNSDSRLTAPLGVYYLNASVLQSLLFQCFFRDIELRSRHRHPSDNKAGVILCRPVPPRPQLMLSVIVPVFNEAATAGMVLEKLTAKRLAGLGTEIIVIESNSSDGSRQVVQQFAHHENVRLILEEKPQGKGHAVRTALKQATGDFVLIQDADLEYDLEDYDALLEPLLAGRRAFVLGARHGGNSWKIRSFSDQPFQALLLNLAHHCFTLLINLSLGLKLDDPFTMFKVFRRDCLHGLRLECNRFDFDWELLIKLVRKGYRPLEIPVNYRSRSFKEGKKIRIIRDPVTWIIAWAKSRFGPLN